MMIAILINTFSVAFAAIIVAAVSLNYVRLRKTEEWPTLSWKEKLWRTTRDSATWALSYAHIVAAAFLNNLEWLCDAIGQPQMAQILKENFDPKVVGGVLLASGLFIMWSRARSLGR